MTWWRMYAAVRSNRKLQTLPADQFKFWVNVGCLACEREGRLPSVVDISWELRISQEEVERMLSALLQVPLIDQLEDGSLVMHDWNHWQYKSDNSTSRVQAFRKRKGNVSETEEAVSKQDEGVTHTVSPSVCLSESVSASVSGSSNTENPDTRARAKAVSVPKPELVSSNPGFGTWAADEAFAQVVDIWRDLGYPLIDEDIDEAYTFGWKRLDFEQRLQCVNRARENKSIGAYESAVYMPKLIEFVRKEYKRDMSFRASKKPATAAQPDIYEKYVYIPPKEVSNGS